MALTTAHLSMSVDGYSAGPEQTFEEPLGRGGEELHHWYYPPEDRPLHEVDVPWAADIQRPRDAYVMGRNMFGPVRGPWSSYDGEWRGWWGEEPPYHAPVFVLTHHDHDPIEMAGGTTFYFVTGGVTEALRRAREVGDGDVLVAGGASTVRQALAAGEVDELWVHVAPRLLGAGEHFGADTTGALEILDAASSPYATHVRYRVQRAG